MLNNRLVDIKTGMLWSTLHVPQALIGSRKGDRRELLWYMRGHLQLPQTHLLTQTASVCVLSPPLWCSSYTSGPRNLRTEKHIRADITRSRAAPRGENKASDRSIHDPQRCLADICGSVRGGSAHSLNSFLNILEADHVFFVVFFFHTRSQVFGAGLSTDFQTTNSQVRSESPLNLISDRIKWFHVQKLLIR